MKIQRTSISKRGFTLLELMVAMAITTIIVTVLVSITSIAIDTWNRSRSELRAARQAKAMVDTMARDFEALVTRRGTSGNASGTGAPINPEWLSAKSKSEDGSPNASDLVFFSAATDRYNGEIGKSGVDLGGDVSCIAYRLKYRDPIPSSGTKYETFVLNRTLVNPDDTFKELLGQADLIGKFSPTSKYGIILDEDQNFVCENIFQFTVTFHVQVTDSTKTPPTLYVPVALGQSTKEFKITGSGIVTDYSGPSSGPSKDLINSGKVTAVEISLTVLSDAGIDLLRKSPGKASDAAWLAKNSYQYSKLIQLTGM